MVHKITYHKVAYKLHTAIPAKTDPDVGNPQPTDMAGFTELSFAQYVRLVPSLPLLTFSLVLGIEPRA